MLSINSLSNISQSLLVGLGRLELPTPRLSSVCSNQLSYRPGKAQGALLYSTSDNLLWILEAESS